MISQARRVAILIVNFCNPRDIKSCLAALSEATAEPDFEIFICENGGAVAFRELTAALAGANGPCLIGAPSRAPEFPISSSDRLVEIEPMSLRGRDSVVWVLRASHNLGYAGAINALVDQLRTRPDWHAIWILNPDAEPAPDALAELAKYSISAGKGMVGSTILPFKTSNRVACRGGLHWSKRTWRTTLIGCGEPIDALIDVGKVESSMDCVTGASMFVTRDCVQQIGPMDERFFLYFEDLDWGVRAKPWGLGYAANSIVVHSAGSTIGATSARRRDRSWLAVYLANRNRIHFIRKHYPLWLSLGAIFSVRLALPYLLVGSWPDFKTAVRGCLAGMKGEVGPPSKLPSSYFTEKIPAPKRLPQRYIKLAISLSCYLLMVAIEASCRFFGFQPQKKLTILYYHGVRSDYLFEFRRQMDMLRRSMNVVDADYKGNLPSTRKSVAITFDDAFVSVLQNALPELSECSFPCTIFVPVEFIGKIPKWETEEAYDTYQEIVMSRKQLNSLPQSVTFGSHGMYHSFLSRIGRESAQSEIDGSRQILQKVIGRDVRLIAVPYGDFDRDVVDACRRTGYDHVYTTIPESVDPSVPNLLRGRVKVDPSDGPLEFFLKCNGAYRWLATVLSARRVLSSRRTPTNRSARSGQGLLAHREPDDS